jgi:hypothetical protein
MLHEHDVVALKRALPGIAVPVRSQGTIVHVHDAAAQAYIVEFVDEGHKTIDMVDVVGDEYLELIWEYKEK